MTKRKKVIVSIFLAAIILIGAAIGVYLAIIPPYSLPFGPASGIPNHAVIAHRGASYLAPEETEPAYILARDMGADYLEMDIQRTKDHALVAVHDDTLERTTNVAQVFPGREKDAIEKFTLDEVNQLDAGTQFNVRNPKRARKQFAGVKVLTLEEIIAIAESGPNKPALYIETKSPELHLGYEQELVDLLAKKGWLGKFPESGLSKVVFQSFGLASLEKLKELAPDVPRIYLIDRPMADEQGWEKLINDAARVGAGIGPVAFIAWPWNLRKAHKAGLMVHVYTLDNRTLFGLFSFFGADGFFTNRCDQLMRFYGKPLAAQPDAIFAAHGF